MDLKVGFFDYIFSTPKNHRYHHSKNHAVAHSNYGGDVIFWDLLFGTFYLPKGEEPSDEIGIEEMPNYPKDFLGLMLAPFTYGKLKKERFYTLHQLHRSYLFVVNDDTVHACRRYAPFVQGCSYGANAFNALCYKEVTPTEFVKQYLALICNRKN